MTYTAFVSALLNWESSFHYMNSDEQRESFVWAFKARPDSLLQMLREFHFTPPMELLKHI